MLSSRLGPVLTDSLAVFPVVLTSLAVIFQPRMGGRVTAAITANAVLGLIGYGVALLLLHLVVVPVGPPLALALTLAGWIGWSLVMLMVRKAALRESVDSESAVP